MNLKSGRALKNCLEGVLRTIAENFFQIAKNFIFFSVHRYTQFFLHLPSPISSR